MIRIHSVTKRFGKSVAVDAVSLDIRAGDSVALWGANGAGKTTLIRCVLGLLHFRGDISIRDHDVRRHGKHARTLIGYVPQELSFYDDLGVAEFVRFFARLKGLATPSVDSALAGVGLVEHARKRVRELSGGMKQRLSLAIAMLGDPPVLILDEVTASLDACGRSEFVSLLSRLSGSGRTMLFASHRVEEVTTLAKRVVVLNKGRVDAVIPAADFAATLAGGSVLHLHMSPASRPGAVSHLRAGGFLPALDGVGILVPVASDQKAGPFRLLAEARITIDDFEIITAGAAASHAHTGSQP